MKRPHGTFGDWFERHEWVVIAIVLFGWFPVVLLATGRPIMPVLETLLHLVGRVLFVPIVGVALVAAGARLWGNETAVRRILGATLIGLGLAAGLWGLAGLVPDIDLSDCPGGPRFC